MAEKSKTSYSISDQLLTVTIPLSAAEAAHIRGQQFEIYKRSAIRHLIGKRLLEGQKQPSSAEVRAAMDGSVGTGKPIIIHAKVGKGPKFRGTRLER